MHRPALLVRRIEEDLLGAEGLLIEFRSLEGAVQLKVGRQSAEDFRCRLGLGLVVHLFAPLCVWFDLADHRTNEAAAILHVRCIFLMPGPDAPGRRRLE